MPELLALADAFGAALAAFDPSLFPGERCGEIAERLSRVAKSCEAAGARAAGESPKRAPALARPRLS